MITNPNKKATPKVQPSSPAAVNHIETSKTLDPTQEVGFVTSINKYLVTVEGLPNIRINELVVSENKTQGLVTAIRGDQIEILILNDIPVKPKESFRRTNTQLTINVGSHLLGRTINPLGTPIDGKGGFSSLGNPTRINQPILGIKQREIITQQFQTGATLVDMLSPLALGQRELIIGDANSGKSEFIIDVIVNQKSNKEKFICVYGIIGKPSNFIRNVIDTLTTNQAIGYTSIIATSSSEKATLINLTPLTAITVAEYFQRLGKDVLLILDDMGIHAKFYREISLISGKPPGRESYPGDLFFQQARIMERAGRFNVTAGGGSITVLPVIETHLDDFTSYMTTNLMGMTDGHLLFSTNRFKEGIRPPIDLSLSVSRVGRQTQSLAQKYLADKVKSVLAESEKLERYSKFGSEISPQSRFILKQGAQIRAILNQPPLFKVPLILQMILLGLVFTPFFQEKDLSFVEKNKFTISSYLQTKFDLAKFEAETVNLKTDKQFIDSLSKIIPELEKVKA
jgi:F-type H+/Na+-transporting ATPase subunit alpha